MAVFAFNTSAFGGGDSLEGGSIVPNLAQRVTQSATGTSVGRSYTSTPTVGNLMLASCVSANGPFVPPAGWNTAFNYTGAFMGVALFWRQVQGGDTAGPYNFTETVSDTLFLELEEWGGFPAGTISLDMADIDDQSFGFTSHSISPGTTIATVELVKGVFGTGSSTATTPTWTQGLTVDTDFVAHRATTAHFVTSSIVNFNPITVSWLNSTNSSTIGIASFFVGTAGVSTLGTTSIGGLSATQGLNTKFGNEYTAAISGTITDFKFYSSGGAADQVFVPIVENVAGTTPTTLLAQGSPVTVAAGSSAGWRTAIVSAPVVAGQTYLLGLVPGDTQNGANLFYAASGTNHKASNGGSSAAAVHNVLGFYPGDGTSIHEVALFKAGGNGGPYVSQSLLKFAIIMTGNNTGVNGDETSFRQATFGHFYDTSAGTWSQYGAGKPRLVVQCGCAFGSSMAMTAAAQGQALTDVANGLHDQAYQYFATGMVQAGYGNSIVRVGHEFDGTWYPWSAARGNEQAYIGAFRRVVNIIRNTTGFTGLIDWCSAGNQSYDTAAYPGDQYVDICGIDYYQDQSNTMATRVPALLGQRRNFAIQQQKQFAVGEWGLSSVFGQNAGDDPTFIQAMYDFFVAGPASGPGSLVYQSYLLADPAGTGYGNIALYHFANSIARYKLLFGP